MTGYVVDASVVMKWLVTEDHSDEAVELLSGGATFVAPALVFAETVNALWAMRQRGDITGADLADAVDMLHSAPISLPVPTLRPQCRSCQAGKRSRPSGLRLLLTRTGDTGAVPSGHSRSTFPRQGPCPPLPGRQDCARGPSRRRRCHRARGRTILTSTNFS